MHCCNKEHLGKIICAKDDLRDFHHICPSKLSKRELEDLYFSLLQSNNDLKKTVNRQSDKLRLLTTRLQRLAAAQKSERVHESKECCLGTKAIVSEQKDSIAELSRANERLSERIRHLNMRLCSAKQFLKRSSLSSSRCAKCLCRACSAKHVTGNLVSTSAVPLGSRSDANIKSISVSCQYLDRDGRTSKSPREADTSESYQKSASTEKSDSKSETYESKEEKSISEEIVTEGNDIKDEIYGSNENVSEGKISEYKEISDSNDKRGIFYDSKENVSESKGKSLGQTEKIFGVKETADSRKDHFLGSKDRQKKNFYEARNTNYGRKEATQERKSKDEKHRFKTRDRATEVKDNDLEIKNRKIDVISHHSKTSKVIKSIDKVSEVYNRNYAMKRKGFKTIGDDHKIMYKYCEDDDVKTKDKDETGKIADVENKGEKNFKGKESHLEGKGIGSDLKDRHNKTSDQALKGKESSFERKTDMNKNIHFKGKDNYVESKDKGFKIKDQPSDSGAKTTGSKTIDEDPKVKDSCSGVKSLKVKDRLKAKENDVDGKLKSSQGKDKNSESKDVDPEKEKRTNSTERKITSTEKRNRESGDRSHSAEKRYGIDAMGKSSERKTGEIKNRQRSVDRKSSDGKGSCERKNSDMDRRKRTSEERNYLEREKQKRSSEIENEPGLKLKDNALVAEFGLDVSDQFCDENRCRSLMEELQMKIYYLEEELSRTHAEYSERMSRLELEVVELRRENMRVRSSSAARAHALELREREARDLTQCLRDAQAQCDELAAQLSIQKSKVAELETQIKAASFSSQVSKTIEEHLTKQNLYKADAADTEAILASHSPSAPSAIIPTPKDPRSTSAPSSPVSSTHIASAPGNLVLSRADAASSRRGSRASSIAPTTTSPSSTVPPPNLTSFTSSPRLSSTAPNRVPANNVPAVSVSLTPAQTHSARDSKSLSVEHYRNTRNSDDSGYTDPNRSEGNSIDNREKANEKLMERIAHLQAQVEALKNISQLNEAGNTDVSSGSRQESQDMRSKTLAVPLGGVQDDSGYDQMMNARDEDSRHSDGRKGSVKSDKGSYMSDYDRETEGDQSKNLDEANRRWEDYSVELDRVGDDSIDRTDIIKQSTNDKYQVKEKLKSSDEHNKYQIPGPLPVHMIESMISSGSRKISNSIAFGKRDSILKRKGRQGSRNSFKSHASDKLESETPSFEHRESMQIGVDKKPKDAKKIDGKTSRKESITNSKRQSNSFIVDDVDSLQIGFAPRMDQSEASDRRSDYNQLKESLEKSLKIGNRTSEELKSDKGEVVDLALSSVSPAGAISPTTSEYMPPVPTPATSSPVCEVKPGQTSGPVPIDVVNQLGTQVSGDFSKTPPNSRSQSRRASEESKPNQGTQKRDSRRTEHDKVDKQVEQCRQDMLKADEVKTWQRERLDEEKEAGPSHGHRRNQDYDQLDQMVRSQKTQEQLLETQIQLEQRDAARGRCSATYNMNEADCSNAASPDNTEREISSMTDLPSEKDTKTDTQQDRSLSPGEQIITTTYTDSYTMPTDYEESGSEGEMPPPARRSSISGRRNRNEVAGNDAPNIARKDGRSIGATADNNAAGNDRPDSNNANPAATEEIDKERRMEYMLHTIFEELTYCKKLIMMARESQPDLLKHKC